MIVAGTPGVTRYWMTDVERDEIRAAFEEWLRGGIRASAEDMLPRRLQDLSDDEKRNIILSS